MYTLHKVFRIFRTESYSLSSPLRDQVLQGLHVPKAFVTIDLFANHVNKQESLYMTRENSAFRYNWSLLRSQENQLLWANPPFSQLSKVVTKLCLEPTKMVLVHPDWCDDYWAPLLKSISESRIEVKSGKPFIYPTIPRNLYHPFLEHHGILGGHHQVSCKS